MKRIILILILLVFIPGVSYAAEVSVRADKKSTSLDGEFLVEVFLNTEGKMVNALEGKIMFPANLLELKEVRDGNSSVNFWIEKPHIINDGEVAFSGITAGGFSGPNRFLFALVFRGEKTGSGSITINNMQILENDGLGTKISTRATHLAFSISGKSTGVITDTFLTEDTDPPEDFSPFVANDPALFEGQYFIVFSTTDKGTGIDHYEVRESHWSTLGLGGQYVVAESPHVLKDQTLKSKISLKAIDKAGNEKTIKLGAGNKLAYFLQFLILGIITLICFFVYRKLWRRST